MSEESVYDRYPQNAQRHIYPLYMADGRGGYEFSSTVTFLRLKNQHFCVFAAHALPPNTSDLNQIGMFTTSGEFRPLSKVEISHKICRDRDLVACHTTGPFEHKNYFDLSIDGSSTEFSENFGWIGFPKQKAVQRIHNTRASKEKIQKYLTDGAEGLKKWTQPKYLLLGVELESISEKEVTGIHINKNVTYAHEGFKPQGYSLKGMSGGALFRGPKKIHEDSPRIADLFQFIGIGLEYKNDRLVKGASRYSVQEMLEETLRLRA